jgi:enamine deaminase RidA (YjgF/YER057c/UK114 family)
MRSNIIESNSVFTIYETRSGGDVFLTASIHEKSNPTDACDRIYRLLGPRIKEQRLSVVHERLFGTNRIEPEIRGVRRDAFRAKGLSEWSPITWVQGNPIWGEGFSGVQIRAVEGAEPALVRVGEDGAPVGRSWDRDGATFWMLQSMTGAANPGDQSPREEQTARLFERIQETLLVQGISFKNVVRTWIYLDDILDWYGSFNHVRNAQFERFGLLNHHPTEAEAIYMPASTGIEGKNPSGAAAVVDALAVSVSPGSKVRVRHTTGVSQRSPFRYGSAFSRAVTIEDDKSKQVLVSGTAAIDENGQSLFPGDATAQIEKTFSVVEALAVREGAALSGLAESTVFIKRPEDYDKYRDVIKKLDLEKMPVVVVIADVCRDELLFEVDAIAVG